MKYSNRRTLFLNNGNLAKINVYMYIKEKSSLRKHWYIQKFETQIKINDRSILWTVLWMYLPDHNKTMKRLTIKVPINWYMKIVYYRSSLDKSFNATNVKYL